MSTASYSLDNADIENFDSLLQDTNIVVKKHLGQTLVEDHKSISEYYYHAGTTLRLPVGSYVRADIRYGRDEPGSPMNANVAFETYEILKRPIFPYIN